MARRGDGRERRLSSSAGLPRGGLVAWATALMALMVALWVALEVAGGAN